MSNRDDRKARKIPDEFLPMVEQGLLNLAANGEVRIIRGSQDITRSLLAQSGRINKDYEATLAKIRSKRSVQRKPASADRPHTPVNAKPAAPGIKKPAAPKMKTA